MLPAPHPCGGAAAPAGWLSPSGITKSAPVPRFRRPKHSSFCRVIVAARARSTSLQLPILDCRLYFTGQHRKNQYFFAGPYNFFAAARVFAPTGECSARSGAFLSLHPPFSHSLGPASPTARFLFFCQRDISRSGATAFCPRRQKAAKTPPKTNGFWNSFRPIAVAVQKGSAANRLCAYPRCR